MKFQRTFVVGALCACSLLAVTPHAAAQRRSFDASDVKRLVGVGDPAISPDGTSVAIVVTRTNYGKDRYDREIDLVDVASGDLRRLTFDRSGIAAPHWSPDGTRLAFVADDNKHRDQVWVMPMNGGDARRITNAEQGVEQFAWRPDGDALAYVAEDDAPKRSGPAEKADLFTIANDDLFVEAAPNASHIWLVPAAGGDARRLTHGNWSLPVAYPPGPPSAPSAPISWSPDGKRILYTRLPNAHDGDAYLSALYALDVASGTSRKLTTRDRFEGFGTFAPRGERYSYLYNKDGDPNDVNEVHVASDGSDRIATGALDRNPYRALWMPDGETLLVGANDAERAALWLQPADGPAKRLDLGDVSVRTGYWLDADVAKTGAIAFVGSTPAHPSELYVMASADAQPKRLTNLNAATDALALATAREVAWTNDGFHENGVLWTPPGVEGKKLPLVLFVHGGPTAASELGFDVFAQAIANRGFLVFEPNYRGSDHLGNVYQRAIFNDLGAGPARDVMAGVAAVEGLGNVDRSRIAVTGWSYGGYMTSWLEGHYGLWKTAISGAAVNDLVDEYALSDGNVSERYGFGGFVSPFRDAAALRAYAKQSPLTYARNIHTPTLILTDLRDSRVPSTQSFEMYHALQENGTHVEFRGWPIAGHNPSDPVRSIQRLTVWTEWLDRWLK